MIKASFFSLRVAVAQYIESSDFQPLVPITYSRTPVQVPKTNAYYLYLT